MVEFKALNAWSGVRIYEGTEVVIVKAGPVRQPSDLLRMLDAGELDQISQKRLAELDMKVRSHHIGPKATYSFIHARVPLTDEDKRHSRTDLKDLPKDSHLYIKYDGARFHVWLVLEQLGKHYTLAEGAGRLP